MKPMEPMKPLEPMKPVAPWWPESLGASPDSAGSENEVRYACFGERHRLAVDDGSGVKVYDTGEHQVSGVRQRQSDGDRKIVFTSQHGEVDLDTLETVGS